MTSSTFLSCNAICLMGWNRYRSHTGCPYHNCFHWYKVFKVRIEPNLTLSTRIHVGIIWQDIADSLMIKSLTSKWFRYIHIQIAIIENSKIIRTRMECLTWLQLIIACRTKIAFHIIWKYWSYYIFPNPVNFNLYFRTNLIMISSNYKNFIL